MRVAAFRGDELVERTLILQEAPLTTWFLALDDEADAEALARRELWLGC